DYFRDVDAAGLGERLEPRGDIDAIAEDIALLDDDVVKVHPQAQRNASVGQQCPVQSRNRLAQCGGAAYRFDDALELDQHPVAGPPDDISAGLEDLWLDDFGQKESNPGEAVSLVSGEKPTVADEQDRRKSAPSTPSRIVGHDSFHRS